MLSMVEKGKIYIDDGAIQAIGKKNSLFASGIKSFDVRAWLILI